jgi:hypothetical protein
MVVPYARMRPNVTDFVVGGSNVDNTGAPLTSVSTFDKTGLAILTAVPMTFQAVMIQPVASTSTPGIGRVRIDEIKGRVCLTTFVTAGPVVAAVGIYVSELNSNLTKWDVRDPLSATDAARDDYFYLEGRAVEIPATADAVSVSELCFDLKLANPLMIGGGQALHVTVSYVGPASAKVFGFFRTRTGPVA